MAKKVWKIGKFEGGINSYSNPKDIRSNEYADLQDIDVSKKGIAKVLGGPEKNDNVGKLYVGKIIPGRGLYRFSSDNSFSARTLEFGTFPSGVLQTAIGGGGEKPEADFSVISAIWLFYTTTANNLPTGGTLTCQLKVGDTPIMLPLNVIAGTWSTIPQQHFPYAGMTGEGTWTQYEDSATTNVFIGWHNNWMYPNGTAQSWEDFLDNQYGNYAAASFPSDFFAPAGTSTPHRVVLDKNPFGWMDLDGDDNMGYNLGTSGNGPGDSWAWVFWDNQFTNPNEAGASSNFVTNLTKAVLPFSASYSFEDGQPTGAMSFRNHCMMGFYMWDGYKDDIVDETGFIPGSYESSVYWVGEYPSAIDNSHWSASPHWSKFYVPQRQFHYDRHEIMNYGFFWGQGHQQWGQESSAPVDWYNYLKCTMSFQSFLIEKINQFSGSSTSDRFDAQWSLFDPGELDADGVPQNTYSYYSHETNIWPNGITIRARDAVLLTERDINIELTVSSLTGTNVYHVGQDGAYQVDGSNRIVNGTFASNIDGWETDFADHSSDKMVNESDTTYIRSDRATTGDGYYPLEAGKWYTVSAKIKRTQGSDTEIYMGSMTSLGTKITCSSIGTGYTTYTGQFFNEGGKSEFYFWGWPIENIFAFDDITVYENKVIDLLSSADAYGSAGPTALLSSNNQSVQPVGANGATNPVLSGEHITDYEIPKSGVVISGDKAVTAGVAPTVVEQWVIFISGNYDSGDLVVITAYGDGNDMSNIRVLCSLEAIFGSEADFIFAILAAINANTGTHNIVATAYTSSEVISTYGAGVYPSSTIGIILTATAAGTSFQFTPTLDIRENPERNTVLEGVGDEQIVLISKGQVQTIEPNTYTQRPFKTDIRVYSTLEGVWNNNFSHRHIINVFDAADAESEGNVNSIWDSNYRRYLNWFYLNNADGTAHLENNPLFWDEGSMLRIADSNFQLKEVLARVFKYTENGGPPLEDRTHVFTPGGDPNRGRIMEANPAQWIGHKDVTGWFHDSEIVSPNTVRGTFTGKLKKEWFYSLPDGDATEDGSGMCGLHIAAEGHASNENASMGDIFTIDARMKILLEKKASGGVDWFGTVKYYAVACYDDGSESLPGHMFTGAASAANHFGEAEDENSLTMAIVMRPFKADTTDYPYKAVSCFNDIRINGIRIYYTHSDDNHEYFWNLGKFDFQRGFLKAATVDTPSSDIGNEARYKWKKLSDLTDPDEADFSGGTSGSINFTAAQDSAGMTENLTVSTGTTCLIEYAEMPKSERYEDINKCSPFNETLFVDYKAACIAGRRTFVGNIRVWNGVAYEYYNDRMVVSPANSLDTLPYPDHILDLDISDGDEIVALAAVGDKVIQFKKKIVYILNISTGMPSEYFVEDRQRWKGIIDRNHFCQTDEGLFWFNNIGAWIFDGEEIRDIMVNQETNQQKIDDNLWSSFVSEAALCSYNPVTRDIFIVKKAYHEKAIDADCYIYNLITEAWTRGTKKFYSGVVNKSITNFVNIGNLGDLNYIAEENPGNPPEPPGSVH